MNIPKEVIDKAKEGGWKPSGLDLYKVGNVDAINKYRVVLSPEFWIALGKALNKNESYLSPLYGCDDVEGDWWWGIAMRFYDLILTGGDTDAFWQEILLAHSR